jgi:hypothetical protein
LAHARSQYPWATTYIASEIVGSSDDGIDLVRSLRPRILELGLSDEGELGEVDQAVREHLADPRTVVMSRLLVAVSARKPAG